MEILIKKIQMTKENDHQIKILEDQLGSAMAYIVILHINISISAEFHPC